MGLIIGTLRGGRGEGDYTSLNRPYSVLIIGIKALLFEGLGLTLRLLRGSWAFWGRVAALGARVWDLTTRGQEP